MKKSKSELQKDLLVLFDFNLDNFIASYNTLMGSLHFLARDAEMKKLVVDSILNRVDNSEENAHLMLGDQLSACQQCQCCCQTETADQIDTEIDNHIDKFLAPTKLILSEILSTEEVDEIVSDITSEIKTHIAELREEQEEFENTAAPSEVN